MRLRFDQFWRAYNCLKLPRTTRASISVVLAVFLLLCKRSLSTKHFNLRT